MMRMPHQYAVTAVFFAFSVCLCWGCGKKSEDDLKKFEESTPIPSQSASPSVPSDSPQETDPPKAEPSVAAQTAKDTLQAQHVFAENIRKPVPRTYVPIIPKASGIAQNPILVEIPGNSFLILASSGEFDLQRLDIHDFFQHISTLVMAEIQRHTKFDTELEKATFAFLQGVFRTFSAQKLSSLGLTGEKNLHFALYFVRQTPVLKLWMADTHKFRQILESYWTQHDVHTREPKDIASTWTLVELVPGGQNELAFHWGASTLTLTMVNDPAHAGRLLPELVVPPPPHQTAKDQLSHYTFSPSAAMVGLFDFHQTLNQLAVLQEQAKKWSHAQGELIPKACVKDARRMATQIPRMTFEVIPVSGGQVLGFDAKLHLEIQQNAWIHDIAAYHPQQLNLPKTNTAPLFQIWTSLPMAALLNALEIHQEDVKREPFTCPALTFLNGLTLPPELDILRESYFLLNDHHATAALYEQREDIPQKFAFTYYADQAAEAAYHADLFTSEILKAQSEVQETETMETEEPRKPIEDETSPEVLGTQDDATKIYTDAVLNPELDLPQTTAFHIQNDKIFIASDKTLLERLKSTSLQPTSSLVQAEISERFMDIDMHDKDPHRDYKLGIGLDVTPKHIEINLKYAIE